jgi:hypothetical protein
MDSHVHVPPDPADAVPVAVCNPQPSEEHPANSVDIFVDFPQPFLKNESHRLYNIK